MKKILLGIIVAMAGSVAVPFAQEQPSPSSKAAEPAHNVFVLTGCIREGSETTPTFKLTDASSIGQPVPGRAAGSTAVGTSGQKDSYELRPVSGIDSQGLDAKALMAHLNERVELVARLIETPAPAPPTGAALAQAAKPTEPAPQRFSVTEIRRVLGTCRE
jgi:hypothetical protein